jgi:phospholipid transport system substrate-binding protein
MRNFKRKLSYVTVALILGSSIFATAEPVVSSSSGASDSVSSNAAPQTLQDPAKFLADFVGNIKHQVAANQVSLASSPEKLYALVEQDVLPNVSLDEMAGMALGPKWKNATPEVRKEFIVQFSQMVTRNYSSGLLKVSDYTFKIYPVRDAVWKREKRVSINGVIQPNSGQAGSNVTYYLERSGNAWKIYDMAVEGVSFVSSYRSQFESYETVEDLIPALKALNERSK